MDQTTKEQGKTMAIVSYITIIGLAIAYFTNQGEKKNEFVTFHIGQSIRVFILALANMVLSMILPSGIAIISTIISLGVLALLIIGIVNALNLKETPIPVIGTIGG